MERRSILQNKVIGGLNVDFFDAHEDSPFADARNSFKESDQSISSSVIDSINDQQSTVSVISEHTLDSPSSPSSAGLRHRRLTSPGGCNEFSQSQFFKNNPDGLIDFGPHGSRVSPEKRHGRSWILNDYQKSNESLNFTTDVSSAISSGTHDARINEESITVRVDFLSSDGKLLGSSRQPIMLQFKSQPIRLVSTFFKLASLLTGYSSEAQTLDVKFRGYTEKDVHTSCSRVVIEQRAEFARRGGVPEIYSASLKIESQLPFVRRMLCPSYFHGNDLLVLQVLQIMTRLPTSILVQGSCTWIWLIRLIHGCNQTLALLRWTGIRAGEPGNPLPWQANLKLFEWSGVDGRGQDSMLNYRVPTQQQLRWLQQNDDLLILWL
ncbi:hypothetical protein E3N88_36718 [Mikania micrantha]|uniref:Uncharacterized protein n=1 Tax=Mikania micrantha TaxID=192012 RepID=A0A5N6M527_9ASTR|nr:hypothetical protein E3N88_36718 [Mikania micrantha]